MYKLSAANWLIASLEAAAQAGRATPSPGRRSRLPQPMLGIPILIKHVLMNWAL